MSFREGSDPDNWAELHGETRADLAPTSVDERVRCYVCKALVHPRETHICEQAGCENVICEDCQESEPDALRVERGIPTCWQHTAR